MPLSDKLSAFPFEAGIDEAGRGCLAGPVVAAAVILPGAYEHPLLNDSKQLSEAQRLAVREDLLARALAWGIGVVGPERIDAVNILNATYEAMHIAIAALQQRPDFLAIDGNRFRPYPGISHECAVKGDARFRNIAAASVLAKTTRDALMLELHAEYPDYGWDRNKGYPTEAHREALRRIGPSPWHRRSFNWGGQLSLFG